MNYVTRFESFKYFSLEFYCCKRDDGDDVNQDIDDILNEFLINSILIIIT